jgi:hypothetical protein
MAIISLYRIYSIQEINYYNISRDKLRRKNCGYEVELEADDNGF